MGSILIKSKKRLVFFFILFLICFFSYPGFIFSQDVNYPDWTGYINDYAGLLDSGSRSGLEALASKIEEETGSEIAVAIVDSLQGITVEEYAVGLFEKWGIGKEKEDNGVLILICTEGEPGNRPSRIEVGYGLEGVVTDLEAGEIVHNIIDPNFHAGDYYEGLYNAITVIAGQIYEEEGLEPPADFETLPVISSGNISSEFPFSWICCFPIPLIIIIGMIFVNFFKKRCPGCRKFKLKTTTTVLKAATYTESGKSLVERLCSNCGYNDKKEVTIPKKTRSSTWIGGSGFRGGGSSGGGGFGGFGGGSSGGGGASGGW
ncbi:MAG: TPM domain-containing protein [Actinomycetota bacterium]|nr:TPM domain-containing protein [Actinomycetota bacterium]